MIDMRQRELDMVAHTQMVNAGREPKFGDRMRNLWAGIGNPLRDATFIREVHKTGRTNPGRWYEMTDENGRVWLSSPTGMIFCDRISVSEALGGPFAATANDGEA